MLLAGGFETRNIRTFEAAMSPPPPPPTILLLHFEYACRHRTQARTHLNIIYLALTRSFFKKNLRSN